MSLATNVRDLAVRIATEAKSLRTLINGNAADLAGLATTDKSSLLAAVNEIAAAVATASGIDDTQTSTSTSWSSTKTRNEIDAAVAGVPDDLIDDGTPAAAKVWSSQKVDAELAARLASLVDAAPGALDTLNELAAALGDNPNFATETATALGNRVRVDAAQSFDATQRAQARSNIGAASATDVGDTSTDFVAAFVSGLA